MLAALGTALLLLVPAPASPQEVSSDGASLEATLERYRTERDAALERLRTPVSELIERLETTRRPGRLTLEELRTRLDELGPEAALLLLPEIDPLPPAPEPSEDASGSQESSDTGDDPAEPDNPAGRAFRAEEITLALIRMHPPGVLRELSELAESASPVGRRNAVRVLGAVPEAQRASVFLADLFRRSTGDLRLAVARSLGQVGAPPEFLRTALRDKDPRVVAAVLDALAKSNNADAAATVLELSSDPAWGEPVATGLLAFWRHFPERVDAQVLHTLVALALRRNLASETRVAVLEALPAFRAARDRAVRRELEPLTQSSTASVREAALVASILLGERGARRTLLSDFDRTIKENSDWWKGYAERGRILLAIHDYSAAAKDLRQALDLLEQRSRTSTHDDLWVDLARCQVLSGKLSRAADTLQEMGLTRSIRERLRADPDFAPLREHSRYGKLFE